MKEAAGEYGKYIENTAKSLRPVTDEVAASVLSVFNSFTELDSDDVAEGTKELAEETFYEKFAERAVTYPVVIFIVSSGFVLIDLALCGQFPGQGYGLGIELVGALILGRGLLMGDIAIGAAAASKVGMNPVLVKTMATDAVDGVYGVFVILFGASLQFVAVAGYLPVILQIC